MPEKKTVEKAREDLREGKSPSTAAGEFVHAEIEHVREGKHGVRSPKQAIAIGLSEARRAGIPLGAPKRGKSTEDTRQKAEKDLEKGRKDPQTSEKNTTRSRAREKALKKEPKSSASHEALSRQAKSAARKRKERS
jgi:hypothetical protein